jgi:Flp pilus assembly protein TadD
LSGTKVTMRSSDTKPRVKTSGAAAALCLAAILAAACSNPEVEKVKHLERGDEYAAENRDEFAVIEYASAVRLDPKYGEARLKLAETHERMNNLRAAAPEFIRAADALPDNRDAQIKATQILLLAGRFEDAKARVTTLLEKNPKDLDALLLRANAMAALKDPAGALAEIEEALQVDPDESRTFVNLGAIRMQAGDAVEAEAAFRQAIALEPTSVDAHLALGNYLWAAGRAAEAEQAIKHGLVDRPAAPARQPHVGRPLHRDPAAG